MDVYSCELARGCSCTSIHTLQLGVHRDVPHMGSRQHDGDLLTARRRVPVLVVLAKEHEKVKIRKQCVQPLNKNRTSDGKHTAHKYSAQSKCLVYFSNTHAVDVTVVQTVCVYTWAGDKIFNTRNHAEAEIINYHEDRHMVKSF